MTLFKTIPDISVFKKGELLLTEVPQSSNHILAAQFFDSAEKSVVYVVPDDADLEDIAHIVRFFSSKDNNVFTLPAWDTLPYDRLSPRKDLMAARMLTLSALKRLKKPSLVIAPVSSLIQRFAPPQAYDYLAVTLQKGKDYSFQSLPSLFVNLGFRRVETVRDAGEFALRGGILDFLSGGSETGIRLDFFGDRLEKLRHFDPLTQRSTGECREVSLHPTSEVLLGEENISFFRKNFRETFGMKASEKDPLYEAISEKIAFPGMEQWLPFFFEKTFTLFDLMPDAFFIGAEQTYNHFNYRFELIKTYYQERLLGLENADAPYHPIKPDGLYLDADNYLEKIRGSKKIVLTPRNEPSGKSLIKRFQHIFALKEASLGETPFEKGVSFIQKHISDFDIVITASSLGAQERLKQALGEALGDDAFKLKHVVLPLKEGFIAEKTLYLTEIDLLGEHTLTRKKLKKADRIIKEASELSIGDFVVHNEHGIAAYDGLETLTIGEAPHDCLKLVYAGGDKLYVPVENSNVISRYGPSHSAVSPDKLGSISWQGRKAKVKKRLLELAEKLIDLAAKRALEKGDVFVPDQDFFQKFCERFPYIETDDQMRAIEEVLADMGSGRVMDRLVCGDVGFGKTEVALRAAMLAVLSGHQVALIVPTTLLARQHYQNFKARFEGFPFRIEQLSRFVKPKDKTLIKKEAAQGKVDILIGTHALLADSLSFKNLGLMIVDEEQHFGVMHKEKLKRFRAGVHVLTMTATPIPRTLQMSLVGLREMSLITTPPPNRQPVSTFVMSYDGPTIKEAIERERSRGGKVFYVVPRVSDLARAEEQLLKILPDLKMTVVHGGMSANVLEEAMLAFVDGKYDVLLSTNIVESGIDIPTANTLIVYRADLFGLSQLYQLKGRVGRGRDKGYAYFTTLSNMILAPTTQRRLELLQSLDHLGAGFTLASYDLDLRGAGNILGDEQSGHVKEVGVELYQSMLQDAVAQVKAQNAENEEDLEVSFSPQINLNVTVLIPEDYVADLSLRLNLYRRIADLKGRDEVDAFAAEMIDRFGKLPEAVHNLFEIVLLKNLCIETHVEKIDVGPKGATVTFYQNMCPYGAELVEEIAKKSGTVSLRPDHKLVYLKGTDTPKSRLNLAESILKQLQSLARKHKEEEAR